MDESSKESSGERQSQEPEAAKLTNEKPTNETPAGETPAGVPASTAPANEAAASGDASSEAHAHGAAGESMLPVVWSPKLGGDEVSQVSAEDTLHSAAGEDMHASGEAPEGRSGCICRHQWWWIVTVGARRHGGGVACGRRRGWFVHRLAFGNGRRAFLASVRQRTSATAHNAPATKAEPADVSALKANLDAATRGASGQLAKLAERLDRLERASGRAGGEACPHRRSARSAREENRDGGRIRRRFSGDNRHHPERRAGGERSEVVRQSAAGLDRARSARRPRAD